MVKGYLSGKSTVDLISTGTASNSAAIEFTDLSSSHFLYIVVIDGVIPVTDNVDFYMRTSTDNGVSFDSGVSDYAWDGEADTDQTSDHILLTSTNSLAASLGSASGETYSGVIWIYNPSDTGETRVSVMGSSKGSTGAVSYSAQSGARVSQEDVDAIQFLTSSGNISSGTFKLYGLSAT